jgi:hypothetical protein
MQKILNLTQSAATEYQIIAGVVDVSDVESLRRILTLDTRTLEEKGENYLIIRANRIMSEFVLPWRDSNVRTTLEERLDLESKNKFHRSIGYIKIESREKLSEAIRAHVLIDGRGPLMDVLKSKLNSNGITYHYYMGMLSVIEESSGEKKYKDPVEGYASFYPAINT